MFILVKLVDSENRPGMKNFRCLDGQTFADGTPVDPQKPVAGPTEIREAYPTDTVFITSLFTRLPNGNYSVSQLCPVNAEPLIGDNPPTKEMLDHWNKYSMNAVFTSKTLPKSAEKKAAPKVETPFDKISRTSSEICTKLASEGFKVQDRIAKLLIANICYRHAHTMLVGPTGTGKTELVMNIARELQIPIHIYDMGSMHDPMSQMLGNKTLVCDSVTGNTVTSFEYAAFVEDVQHPGIILLDELSRAPKSTNNILLPCLDSRRMLPVEMAGDKQLRKVDVHPDCIFISTANIGAEYTGTSTLDAALADRFNVVEVGYSSQNEEAELLRKRYCVDAGAADAIAKTCAKIRQLFSEEKISRPLSTRDALSATSLVALGWSCVDAQTDTFLTLFDGTGGATSERQTVHNVILGRA